ncbi:MAG: hisA, partial [Firmicutes bacterium]|nr:hisA [Bacillota bacterium]
MIIFPAIDLYGGQAVRLYKGDYDQMTVYDKEPIRAAVNMELQGATHLHLVDLEGAKTGQTPHLPVIRNIVNNSRLFVEVGGGIRSLETIEGYLNAGAKRVILGTAAVQNPDFAAQAIREFGRAIAI